MESNDTGDKTSGRERKEKALSTEEKFLDSQVFGKKT